MKTLTACIAAGVVCAAGMLQAQSTNTTTPPRPPVGAPLAELTFEKMDANGDGKLTFDEYQAAMTKAVHERVPALSNVSSNAAITKAQIEKGRAGMVGSPLNLIVEMAFAKADANHDGTVTTTEFQTAMTEGLKKRFTAMDANGDGVLTKDEMEKAREPRGIRERFRSRGGVQQ